MNFPKYSESSSGLSETAIDNLFKILSHSFRRYTLLCLQEHRAMTLDDLAEEVAARVNEKSKGDLPVEDVERVFQRLYHTHIPMLTSAHMVDSDQSTTTVTIRDHAQQPYPFLSMVEAEPATRA